MQTKTTSPVRMAKMKNSDKDKGEREKMDHSYIANGMQNGTAILENSLLLVVS